MSRGEKLTIHNLVVVDYQKAFETSELKFWKTKNLGSRVACAEKCARQVMYCSQTQLEDFPRPEPHGQYRMLKGQDAYAFLLQFMLGLGNSRGVDSYDPAALERFFKYWSAINRRAPKSADYYEGLVYNLTADYRAIKKCAGIDKIQPPQHWFIARDFAGQKKDECALIIGDTKLNRNDETMLTQHTERMAVSINDKGVRRAGSLDFTHPDEATLRDMHGLLRKVYRTKEIRIGLNPFDFYRDLPLALEYADSVYVTMDMDQDPEADQFIIDSWKGRVRRDNTLVHLRAAPDNMALSSERWRAAGLDNYFSPEDIRAESAARSQNFRQTADVACKATVIAAQMRVQGQTPGCNVLRQGSFELEAA